MPQFPVIGSERQEKKDRLFYLLLKLSFIRRAALQ
jgi:hypothetical protein